MVSRAIYAFFEGISAFIPPVALFGALRADLQVFVWALRRGMFFISVTGEAGTYRGIVIFFYVI